MNGESRNEAEELIQETEEALKDMKYHFNEIKECAKDGFLEKNGLRIDFEESQKKNEKIRKSLEKLEEIALSNTRTKMKR